jgi:hypothetical protein
MGGRRFGVEGAGGATAEVGRFSGGFCGKDGRSACRVAAAEYLVLLSVLLLLLVLRVSV